jgi:hypothetical protein
MPTTTAHAGVAEGFRSGVRRTYRAGALRYLEVK